MFFFEHFDVIFLCNVHFQNLFIFKKLLQEAHKQIPDFFDQIKKNIVVEKFFDETFQTAVKTKNISNQFI